MFRYGLFCTIQKATNFSLEKLKQITLFDSTSQRTFGFLSRKFELSNLEVTGNSEIVDHIKNLAWKTRSRSPDSNRFYLNFFILRFVQIFLWGKDLEKINFPCSYTSRNWKDFYFSIYSGWKWVKKDPRIPQICS